MLGTAARSRVALTAAVLLTTGAGGSVLGPETGAPALHPPASATAATYGPQVPRGPVARPLVPAGGLLGPARAPELPVVAAADPPAPAVPARPADAVVVGPGAPAALVREVQQLLNARGAALAVDGTWGPATERAVRAAQARAGLPVDGRVGPATRAALD